MSYILLALALFIVSVLAHIVFCRFTTKTGLQFKAYGIIVGVSFAAYVAMALVMPHLSIWDPDSIWGIPFQMTAGAIFALLVPTYMTFYALTQLMSPSKRILLAIASHGELAYEDLLRCVKEERFIETRMGELCSSGCVLERQGSYSLSASGRRIVQFLQLMQFLLGREAGG